MVSCVIRIMLCIVYFDFCAFICNTTVCVLFIYFSLEAIVVVLKYAKPSRRNLDNWSEGAYGCLESRRPVYQNSAVSSPHLYCYPRWVWYFPEVNRSGPHGIPARSRLFQLHGTRRLLTTIHHNFAATQWNL